MECQARIIDEKCGCVAYYMPRLSRHTRICGRADYACFRTELTAIERSDRTSDTCKCLSGCFELSFVGNPSTAPIITSHVLPENSPLKKFSQDYIE